MSQKEETLRQKKVGSQIQRDMSEILLTRGRHLTSGKVVSITRVRMTPDLAVARVNVSVFPFEGGADVIKALTKASGMLRGVLGERVRHQLRIVPDLTFYLDDSIEYAERIEKLIAL